MRILSNLNKSELIFVVLLLLTIQTYSNQVDSFNLLFPTSYHPIKGHARQIVTTSGGCYDWKSTQNTIVKVKGTHQGLQASQSVVKNQECQSNGIIQLVKAGPYPATVQITAKERGSNEQITIPVRVRDLKRISIFTKSKIMNIKQIQNLQVYGFDSENNAFTSLQGLRFRWLISEINGKQSTGSITKILLAQSSLYLPLDTRRKIQEQGAQTDLLVVKGLKVGSVSVKVRCLEQNYQMISDEIILYIQQKFQIFPVFPVHLIAGSKFQYTLKSPTGQTIQVPSPYYDLRLTDSSFQVNNRLEVKAPRKDGEATLYIIDRRTEPAFNQSIKIYSYQPDQIQILVPEQIIIGQEIPYEIKFNRNKQLLKGDFDPTLLSVKFIEQRSDSDDIRVFQLDRFKNKISGTSKGSGLFRVEYNGLIAEKKIYSITPLKLLSSSSNIILPIGQIYQLSIVGGSGSYKYTYSPKSQEQSILSISFNGLITTRKEGLTVISVVDQKNSNNRIQIQVYILKMGNIYSLEQYRQFNLNEDGSIYIKATPRSFKFSDGTLPKNQHFTECNDALLRGLVFSPIKNSQSHQTPLKIITINPINDQTLRQIQSLAQINPYISKLLKQGSQINQKNVLKQFQMYEKYREIKSSQLLRLVAQMENYGLCAKVFVKAVIPFDGQVDIERYRDQNLDSHSSNMKLRVYSRLVNNIVGLELQAKEIIIAPLASFRWKTQGGPYRWNDEKIGNMQVYINNAKIESNRDQYPRISCSSSEISNNIYTLKSQNPASYSLPRPVVQQKQISVYCRAPELLLVGLPLKYGLQQSGQQTKNFIFLLSQVKKSTVYIYPGQCFRIFLQPVLKYNPLSLSSNQQYTQFFNASNVKYEFKGAKYGKLQEIPKYLDENKPKSWNTVGLKYESKDQNIKDQLTDHIIITAYQFQSKSGSKRLVSPITFEIDIKTLKPLKLTKQFQMIDLPNNPSNPIKIHLQENTDPARFSLQYDQSVFKCVKSGNQITIIPQNIDRTQIRTLKVIDQFAIGRPSFQIPIKVSFINGVDLRVSRVEKRNQLMDKEKLQSNIWLFDEEEFIAYVDVYTYNSSLTSLGKSPKQSINGIDPHSVQIKMQKINEEPIKQIERTYDPLNKLIIIRFKIPKVFEKIKNSKINSDGSEAQRKVVHKLSAVIKSRSQQISSNSANLQIYDQISLSGFPTQEFSIKNKQDYLIRQILTIIHIMESCQTVIEIIGGPAHLNTKIQSNRGEKQFFNIIKLTERRYKIQTIKSTPEIMVDPSLISLTKKQDNLLSIVASTNQNNPELTIVYCLIIVVPIKNIRIEGLSSLLSGRKSRYLVQFGKNDVNNLGGNSYKVIQDKCSLKYLWKVSSIDGRESQVLILNSDNEKMGVNVTALPVTDQQQLKRVTSNPISELSVKVLNKMDRQITDAKKSITVLVQQQFPILTQPNPHRNKNQMITLTNTQVFLIPPHSSLQLSYNYVVEEMTPCSLEDPKLSIMKQNQIVTGQANKIPELIKISYRQFGGSRQNLAMPIFLPVLVTDICAVVIDNIDGAIAINPTLQNNVAKVMVSATPQHLQLVRFNILDCIGRKFLHYNYKNIQYRVSVTSPNVVTAKLYSIEEGLISLQGHQIGQAQVTLQVILNGVLKAKDIIPIYVNIFIRPSKPISVHIGDLIGFKGPSSGASAAKWLSTDNRIIKINPRSGQAVGASEGQTYIQYGAMSTRVSVVKIVDIKGVDEKYIKNIDGPEQKNNNGYTYEIIYSGTVYANSQDKQLVKSYLNWQCEVLGKQGEHLRGIVKLFNINNKQYLRCYLQKKSGTKTMQTSISSLKIRLTAQNKNIGFKISRQFEQNLQVFIILSQKYVNPRDPKIKKEKTNYQITVQTNQRLDVFQTGGKEHWIVNNVFTGARQVITIDLTQYRGGEWKINLSNSRTKQLDYILISHDKPEGSFDETSSSSDKQIVNSGGWKWTDMLVVFMAINFLLLVGYQIMKNNSSFHSKTL